MITSIHGSRCLLPFRSVHLHAALNTVRKVVSVWSFKYVLGLVQNICRASYAHGGSVPMSKVFIAFNIFFKVKMLCHLWWYCIYVISSLPKSLMMCRTGMTLDFCGFQQSFPWVQVLKCHLPLNSGKCNLRELAALVGCINLLNLSCFWRVLSEPVA